MSTSTLSAPSPGAKPFSQLVRAVLGGLLMGIANLVPGISGGTMLLAAGVYPQFIQGIAEVTRLQFRRETLVVLIAVCGAGALAIATMAGLIKGLVVEHRWVMYSLFIGLTLGGVPVVWKLLRRLTATAAAGCALGIALMVAMVLWQPGAAVAAPGERAYLILFFAGLAGASAMILPGVSGGYLLLVLGQYITILRAIDSAKTGLLAAGGPDWAVLLEAMHVFVPVGLGVVLGVVGVSNVIRHLLQRYEKATLGFLLGLLFGAVIGLWPFQQGRPPLPGEVVKGRVMTADSIAAIEPEDFPLETFGPSAQQIGAALALIAAGFAVTQLVAWVGGGGSEGGPQDDATAGSGPQ
jgi:putative membrane protein